MRQETIAKLLRHLNAVVLKTPGQLIGLWGEAGVGKSFLLESLLGQILCKHLIVRASMSVAEIAGALSRPSNLPAWAKTQLNQLERGQTLDAQALEDTLAVTLSGLAPFVLVFEDAHDTNPERFELILKLSRVVPRLKGVALLVSSRTELPATFRSYRLEALDRGSADALLEAQAKAPLPREGLDWVYARAQGNALFTIEFWRYLLRQGAFWSDSERWQWRKPNDDFLPVSIEALILELLEHQMDAPTRAVLEAKALLEQTELTVSEQIWASVADVSVSQLLKSQNHLETSSLLRAGRFAHPLFREVLTPEIPAQRWELYAKRAVAALELEHPEQAAAFLEILKLEPEDARRLLEAAQKSAEARGDRIAAAKWLGRRVEFLDEPERSQIAFEAALETYGFDLAGAEKLARLATSGNGAHPKAVVFHAEILALLGQGQSAEVLLEDLEGNVELKLPRLQTLLFVKQIQGKYEEVIQTWNTHPELHDRAEMRALSNVGFAYFNLAQLEKAECLLNQMFASQILDAKSLYYTWNLQASIHAARGKYTDALQAYDIAIGFARQMQSPRIVVQSLKNHSIVARYLGLFQDARNKLQAALDLCSQFGLTHSYSAVQDILSSILMKEGRFEEAEILLKQSEKVFALNDNLSERCTNHLDQAELYLEWQPTSGIPLALRHARAGLRFARETGSIYHLTRSLEFAARAEALNKNPKMAMQLATELQVLVEKAPPERTRSLYAMGFALEALGHIQEARVSYLDTQAAAMDKSDQEDSERVALEADRLTGDIQSARKRHAWFTEQGLLGDAKVALRYFPNLTAADPLSSVTAEPTEPTVRLNVLGLPQLERDGQAIVYRGKKRLELLCYLLEARIAGKNEVSAMELAEVFYPDDSEKEGKHTLRQQVYLIRANLGNQCIQSTTNGYALEGVSSDAELFLETGDTSLWRGAYLERVSEGWDGNVSECLVQALRSGFERLLETHLSEAARVGEILLAMEPYDMTLLAQVLQAHQCGGFAKSASRLYKEAQERFWDVGENLPLSLEEFLRQASMLETQVLK
jgi:DNA-binding SARP family transcriptional activator